MSLKNVLFATAALNFLPFAALAQVGSSPAAATAPAAAAQPASTPVTHTEFEELLHKTLVDHPEIIMEAVKKMREKTMAESSKQMQESMAQHKQELLADTTSPSLGDPKTTDLTIVEFFDYHCGYCKHMLPVMTQLTENDKKLRVIFREFPILAEDSVLASRAAIAVYNIDKTKYFEYHSLLMKSSGKFDEKTLLDMGKRIGIDPKKLKKEMASTDITKQLDDTRQLADEMGVRGTPALVVGDEMLPGAVSYEDMQKYVAKAREDQKNKKTDLDAIKKDSAAKPEDKKEEDKK